MALWGLPFAGKKPRIEGLQEETYECLALLFGDEYVDGEGTRTRHLLLAEGKDDGTEVLSPLRIGHGLNKAGFLENKAATLQSIFGLQGKVGQEKLVADAVGGVDEYSDMWGKDQPVMKRFHTLVGKGSDGRQELSELCGAHLRRWKRLLREWRKDQTKPASAANIRQTALIGDTVEAMASKPAVAQREDEGVRLGDDTTLALMCCQVCSVGKGPTARLANVRMMCGHAWCSDCFIQSAAYTATEDGVSTRCPSCHTHRCLAVEVGPHIYTQSQVLRAEPAIGSVSHNMLGLAPEAMTGEQKDFVRKWNSKLQLGRREASDQNWTESLRLFGELEVDATQTWAHHEEPAQMLRTVALCHIAWARATPAVDQWLKTGRKEDLEEFENAVKVFDEAVQTIKGIEVEYNTWNKYRRALILGQKGYTYAMAGGRAAGSRQERVWNQSRKLLREADICHEEAGRVIEGCAEASTSRAFALGHKGSIKYSLAGVGPDGGVGLIKAPKAYLEQAVAAFEQQLGIYKGQENPPTTPETQSSSTSTSDTLLATFSSGLSGLSEIMENAPSTNAPSSNTHFAVSDAARLNVVALRLSLGFWNVLLSRVAFRNGNEAVRVKFQREAAECYTKALEVVDERLSEKGRSELPSGQACNLGCFQRIRRIIVKAMEEMYEHAKLDEALAESDAIMHDAPGAEGEEAGATPGHASLTVEHAMRSISLEVDSSTVDSTVDEFTPFGLDHVFALMGKRARAWDVPVSTYDVNDGAEGQEKLPKRPTVVGSCDIMQ